ncbi:WD40-repeat-containing domain protein [Cantharellus anzutake]|uniref:WD40-repeat-containing domain protein n=1 Tax=Cantharellus anzutake TaxID=1750568 RepID=UPI0019030164|nr:WD40-repeat-containing domain protein [Cantharellus anzutake]KAF8338053.1 WD40-repeat-containing domain protein [Cantharellus anzutake]
MPHPPVVEETGDSVHHAPYDADAFFETGSGNVLADIEPIEDNTSFSNHTISTFSNGSGLSTGTFLLRDLCEKVIEKHLWLQMARIVSASCYSHFRNLIRHRFLILQLCRPGRRNIWLRIDRRAGLGFLSLVWKLGTTPAHDTAQLSASRETLAETAKQENTQEFNNPPFLADFGEYLRVISEELLEYKIWPVNCWMFCSLLQEHLEGSGDGYYTSGRAVTPRIALSIRGKISERAAAQVTPNTIMTALQSPAWALNRSWQPLSKAKRKGWLADSIVIFLSQIERPAPGSDYAQDILERIPRFEKGDMYCRITMFCIEALDRLPKENILQLSNPLTPNSDIPDLASQIRSKIPSDAQYAALFGLLHVAEIENPSTGLLSKLETFFTESAIKWLEVLSLLGAASNARITLETLTMWCESQSHRQSGDQNSARSLLQPLLQCRRFVYQYYGVISLSAGHIHSASSNSPDAGWRGWHHGSSYEHLPAVQWQNSGWDGCVNTIQGHTGWVSSVSFSPDGSKVASGSNDQTGRIWDAVTGEELKVLRGHTGGLLSVSFSPDGSKVASTSIDKTLRIWDAVTGEEVKTLRGHSDWVVSVSDGSRVASASVDKTVQIWDAATGEELKVLRGHTHWVHSVSFSFDGSRVASASSDKTIRIWDAVTGEELKVLQGHTDWVHSVSLSSNGSRVASASYDKTVRIWDAVTGNELTVLRRHTDWVRSVSLSPDGFKVALGSNDKTGRIWNAVTGEELKVLRGHTGGLLSVSFSFDGSRVATASDDRTIRIWDVVTGDIPADMTSDSPSNIPNQRNSSMIS